jgi:hypothetical protein
MLVVYFILVSCLAYSWALKTEVTCPSIQHFQHTIWNYIPEDRNLHNHHCGILRSYIESTRYMLNYISFFFFCALCSHEWKYKAVGNIFAENVSKLCRNTSSSSVVLWHFSEVEQCSFLFSKWEVRKQQNTDISDLRVLFWYSLLSLPPPFPVQSIWQVMGTTNSIFLLFKSLHKAFNSFRLTLFSLGDSDIPGLS